MIRYVRQFTRFDNYEFTKLVSHEGSFSRMDKRDSDPYNGNQYDDIEELESNFGDDFVSFKMEIEYD